MSAVEVVMIVIQIILMAMIALNIFYTKKNTGISSGNDHKELSELKIQIKLLERQITKIQQNEIQSQSSLRQEINNTINNNMASLRESIRIQMDDAAKSQTGEIKAISSSIKEADKTHLEKIESNGKLQTETLTAIRRSQTEQIAAMSITVGNRLDDMKQGTSAQLKQFEERFRTLETTTEQKLSEIRRTVSQQLSQITEDNHKQLEQIRGTVDEKLQDTLDKKINESFKLVSERLEQVYKGLGEMQNIAQGVGDLKKVLSNVKTRGILGEIQLGAILKEILAPEQYEENVAAVPKSSERVEFAIRLPGAQDGTIVYLPIDSKFNGDKYTHLLSAYESGDKDAVKNAKKELEIALKKCAKDISDKYIAPPYTTQFAIMFLPFEGLYAEAVSSDLVTVLQREYHVNIAGPSTMAAMLNSLQMGFKTLAIQKRSGEVWQILGAVKKEFGNFTKALEKTQSHIQSVEKDLEDLVGVRTRQINRKLSKVEMIDPSESVNLIDDTSE